VRPRDHIAHPDRSIVSRHPPPLQPRLIIRTIG
jgi:hypothetical protein